MGRNRIIMIVLLTSLMMISVISSTAFAQDATTTYIVQPGDTLNRIAIRNQTTISELMRLNPSITNADLVYVGQEILIPVPGAPATAVPTEAAPAPEQTADPNVPPPEQTADANVPPVEQTAEVVVPPAPVTVSMEYGIEVNVPGQDNAALVGQITALGVGWVKQEVRWRELEATKGQIDFTALDGIVDALDAQGLKILLTATSAPDWARSIQEESGPPDNFADFGTFVSALASRYAGRVDAYEIWNEPNLRSKWKSPSHPIGAASYLELLRHGYDAVKAADPNATIVSAGLAPTGYNDAYNAQAGNMEVNAIDDRVFLQDLYAAGFANYADAVGAHPMGWANPPDSVCCTAAEGVTTHFESPTFYFLNTLQDYRLIMENNGDAATMIWVTKFGWGTSEDLGAPDEINIYMGYTSLSEQALYTVRAFEIGASLGYIGPMFLHNLNGCQAMATMGIESCYYSLFGPDGMARPVYGVVEAMQKGTAPVPSPTPLPTIEATAEATSEATAEATPEATVEATVEATPEATVEATAEATPAVTGP